MLYCDDVGQLYQLKACPYVKQSFRGKEFQKFKPQRKPDVATVKTIIPPKPAKYMPPAHVHQFTPDYSMLSLSKPKRKRKKQDDLTVWFGGVGSTISRKRPRCKKRKKKVCLFNNSVINYLSVLFGFGDWQILISTCFDYWSLDAGCAMQFFIKTALPACKVQE